MAKPQHTTAPWLFESKESPTRITGPNGETVAAVYGGFTDDEKQVANAQLIASAPSLFEYVYKKSKEGDQEATDIVESIMESA